MKHVTANTISPKKLEYECPFCWSSLKKNGQPTKRARRLTHTHGNGSDDHADLSNRIEFRSTHCPVVREDVYIHITDETRRTFDD